MNKVLFFLILYLFSLSMAIYIIPLDYIIYVLEDIFHIFMVLTYDSFPIMFMGVFAVILVLFITRKRRDVFVEMSSINHDRANNSYNNRDYSDAFFIWRTLAEKGDAEAQNNIGGMYYDGKGVPKDNVEAFKWYRRSAEQGYGKAQHNLGLMYYNGDAVSEDCNKAFKWCLKAAEQGYAEAQYCLSSMYYKGQGVNKNYDQAYKWISVAVANKSIENKGKELLKKIEKKRKDNNSIEEKEMAVR